MARMSPAPQDPGNCGPIPSDDGLFDCSTLRKRMLTPGAKIRSLASQGPRQFTAPAMLQLSTSRSDFPREAPPKITSPTSVIPSFGRDPCKPQGTAASPPCPHPLQHILQPNREQKTAANSAPRLGFRLLFRASSTRRGKDVAKDGMFTVTSNCWASWRGCRRAAAMGI